MRFFLWVSLWVACGAASQAQAQVELAADINLGITGRFSAGPSGFVQLGGLAYFNACDRQHGCELWHSDGTAAGTQRVADLCPGSCSSAPRSLAVAFGQTLYFTADDGQHGEEPYAYRPEFGVPRRIGDINPGAIGSAASGFVSASSGFLAGVFFLARVDADESVSANAIVRVTESSGGFNVSLAQAPGAATSLTELRALGERLVFFAVDAAGREPWSMGAVAANTFSASRIADIAPGASSSFPSGLTVHPGLGTAFFAASDVTGNSELWKTDGTPSGTVKVAELRAGANGSAPSDFVVAGTRVFFTADDTTAASGSNRELFVTEGSAASTRKVLEINPSASAGSSPTLLRRMTDGRVMMLANDGSSGAELWISDGSAAGTTRVADLVAGSGGISAFFGMDAEVNGAFYYVTAGARVWRSDGTAAGSRQVGGALPDPIDGFREVHAAGDRMLFSGDSFSGGSELFHSALATPGTLNQLLVIGDEIGHSEPQHFHALPGGDIVMAYDDIDGFEWRRLLPEGGHERLVDLSPGRNDFSPIWREPVLAADGGSLWFVANFDELWRTDGSIAGTRRVFEFRRGSFGGEEDIGDAHCLVPDGDGLFVLTRNFSPSRIDLFRSDGTEAGTVRLLGPGLTPFGLEPDYVPCPVLAGDAVILTAHASATGYEPYRHNRTPGNLTLLRDIVPGARSSVPERALRVGTRAYLVASDDGDGLNRELWISDGTAQGTRLARDLNPAGGSQPRDLVAAGDTLYFTADDGSSGRELYRSDGTAAGTVRIADLYPGKGSAFPSSLPAALLPRADGDRLFFAAATPGGRHLFVSDGTAEGTRALLPPDTTDSLQPRDMTSIDGGVLFSGFSPPHGRELWFSDGSSEGTLQVADIVPGSGSASPTLLHGTSDGALFSADDGERGREPWRLQLARAPDIFGDGFE